MGIALGAGDRGTDHAEGCVGYLGDVFFRDGLPEAGPSGAGIEFGCRIEERSVAADATIESLVFQIPVLPRKGHFSVGVARNVVGVRRQLLAPFVGSLDDLRNAHLLQAFASIGEENDGDLFWLACGGSSEDARLSPLPEYEAGESGE